MRVKERLRLFYINNPLLSLIRRGEIKGSPKIKIFGEN